MGALWDWVMAVADTEANQGTAFHPLLKGLGFIDDLCFEHQWTAQQAKLDIITDMTQRSPKRIEMEASTSRELLRRSGREYQQPPRSPVYCYCISTISCHIGPSYAGMFPGRLRILRCEHTMKRLASCIGSATTKGDWRKRKH